MRLAVLTISDRSYRGERADLAGPAVINALQEQGWQVIKTNLLPDDQHLVSQQLIEWTDQGECDIIFTTGGTGLAPRDVTPEATRSVIEREAPGLAEAMRAASLQITPHAMLSRAVCGIRKRTLIINLPGSPKACLEHLAVILPVLPHAVQLLAGDPASEQGHQR
jgi:molybdenum cofactor synthesis domain-containing protein